MKYRTIYTAQKKIEVLNPYMLPFRGPVFPRQGFLSAYAGKAGFFLFFDNS